MPACRDRRLPALAAAALALACLAGGPLPWYLFYATAGLVLTGFAWARGIRRAARCRITVDRDRLAAGEELQVCLRLENRGLLPVPWVEVHDRTPERLAVDPARLQATSLGPRGCRTLAFRLQDCRRGHYPVGPFEVSAGDGLGLFQIRQQIASSVAVTVYPRVVPISGFRLPLRQPFGHRRSRLPAFQEASALADIRPYRPGDSLRYVHWLTSARRGELHLKQFEAEAAAQLTIALDLAAGAAGPGRQAAEAAIAAAASLADLAVRQGYAVGLLAAGREHHRLPPARGPRGLQQILEALARAEAEGRLPLARLLHAEAGALAAGSTLALVTSRLDPALAGTALQLGSRHAVLLLLLRPAPGSGPALPPEAGAPLEELAAMLAGRGVAVYAPGGVDDLRRLPDCRVTPGGAAGMPAAGWSGRPFAEEG